MGRSRTMNEQNEKSNVISGDFEEDSLNGTLDPDPLETLTTFI